jgi:peroxiredoxin
MHGIGTLSSYSPQLRRFAAQRTLNQVINSSPRSLIGRDSAVSSTVFVRASVRAPRVPRQAARHDGVSHSSLSRDCVGVDDTTLVLEPGSAFPDVELTDHAGNRRRLSELVAGDPTILHFYRGWWCPKEQTYFRRLIELQDEMEVAYARIVSVSVDPAEVAAAFRAGLGARWTFLSDADRSVQARLRLRETTDTVHEPYAPAVFTLFPDLTIHRAYDGYWFWGRATVEELRADMREITRTIRRDWKAPTA